MAVRITGTHYPEFDIAIPDNILPMGAGVSGTTTGIWKNRIVPSPWESVVDFLKNDVDYGRYRSQGWDCEDRAFWGISKARCKFPGLPIAMASGIAKVGTFREQEHAVIVFWYKDQQIGDELLYKYFDPDFPDVVDDFDTLVLVPFPPYRPGQSGVLQGIEPFGNFEWGRQGSGKGVLVLDPVHVIKPIEDIEAYLKDFRYERCIEPADEDEKKIFKDYRSPEDYVFWAFIHARRESEFMGAPIGMALGKAVEGNLRDKDFAVIVLWEDYETYTFWDLYQKREVNFDPRFIIV